MLLHILATIMLLLALCVWRFSKFERAQKALFLVLIIWSAVFFSLEMQYILRGDCAHYPTSSLQFTDIVAGVLGLITLMGYPASVLCRQIATWRRVLLFLSPFFALLAVYVVWHLVTGTPLNYNYVTFTNLWAHRHTVSVQLRLLIIVVFIIYQIMELCYLWILIRLWNRYSEDNYSDVAHNVAWLRLVLIGVVSICTMYLFVIVYKHPISELLYTVSVCVFFLLMTEKAITHKQFVESDEVVARWSWKDGWQLTEKKPVVERKTDPEVLSLLEAKLDAWMQTSKPFSDPDFTTQDVYAVFPELRHPVLKELLARRETTFQAYVRAHRIDEACRLMHQNPDMVGKEIALKIGLSSPWVFSRSFVAARGDTPTEYRRKNNLK